MLKYMPHVTGFGPAKRNETLRMTRLNERMRFLKYTNGQYFRRRWKPNHGHHGPKTNPSSTAHYDGVYLTPDRRERSQYTLHLYLNDSDDAASGAPMEGGATRFHSPFGDESKYLDVEPKVGRVLIFQHRGLLHSGDDLWNGMKYTLRTDLMYQKLEDC